jgi:hypothetical protein
LRIALVLSATLLLATTASAAPAERWLPIAPKDAAHGAMALNLNSIHPAAQKGIDAASVLEVVDAKTAWLTDYEVRCGRSLLHPIGRRPVDAKTGKAGATVPVESMPLMGDSAKPAGQGEEWIVEIVCRPTSAGGHVFADRRAVIWTLSR